MAPVRSYTNWNSRTTDEEEQIEPYRKYFFICEGANTETWYFKKLIDIRKELNIHPLIDIRLLEKTEGDRDISFPRRLIEFAENQKENPEIAFELFLLLHYENSYEDDIEPNAEQIIQNEIAIEQEKKINEDIHQCKGQITCNIGQIIDDIRNDDGKVI